MEVRVIVLNSFTTERIVINAKIRWQEMLQTRIPSLENLYKVKFKINGAVQKNNTSNTNVKKNISSSETTVATTDKNESIILNINENTKTPCKRNQGRDIVSKQIETTAE